jgi:hypothetical protein
MTQKLMEQGTDSGGGIVLINVVFEEEVADRQLAFLLERMVNKILCKY